MAGAGDGSDNSCGADLPHPIIGRVGDIKIAGAVHRQSLGLVQLGRDSRAAITHHVASGYRRELIDSAWGGE